MFVNASHSGPFDQRVGSVSTEVSYLLLIVDGADAVAEEDETNNSGVGHLSDSDDEKTDRLFESTVPDKSDLLPVTTDDFAAVDEGIREVGDWLKAI